MNYSSIFILFSAMYFSTNAQNTVERKLTIGDKIPASVWSNISASKQKKLTILDFWSTGCLSCMEAFPKMVKLQKQFEDDIEVILVNPWENEALIKERIGKLNAARKNNTDLFALPPGLRRISGDTIYKQLFPAKTIPMHVWVNAEASVLYITSGYNANPPYVQAVLKGEKVEMSLKDDIKAEELMQKGYLQPTLPQLPVYYSAFIPYFGGETQYSDRDDSAKNIFRVIQCDLSVLELFAVAFINQMSLDRVMLEMKDKEKMLRPDYQTEGHLVDAWSRKYCFTYEMVLPFNEKHNWQRKMQQDLNYFFGNKFGLEAVMEKRKFKALVLVQNKKGLISTANNTPELREDKNAVTFVNWPFRYVSSKFYALEDMKAGRPYINETGIDPDLKVDMEFAGNFKDLNNIKKQLQRYGLDIIEAERELEVLVIKNKKD